MVQQMHVDNYKGGFMKKILLSCAIALFVCLSAHATYEVRYNNTGTIMNSNQPMFGQNASFTPQNRALQGAKNRYIKHENQYYNGLEKGRTVNININNNNSSENEINTSSTDRKKRSFIKNKFKKVKSDTEN